MSQSRKSFESLVLRVANLLEAIIACQMNSIEYGVMLDLNLKGYTFFIHTVLYRVSQKKLIHLIFK
jgi:hypothetical protein